MVSLAKLDEDIQSLRGGKNVLELAEKYHKKYRSQMNVFESHSLIGKVRSLNEWDFYALGSQLESFKDYLRLCEADGSLNQLGSIPQVALDVITVALITMCSILVII